MNGAAVIHPYETQLAMRERLAAAADGGLVAFVDLGAHKTAVLIGETPAPKKGAPVIERSYRILGAGVAASTGVAAGASDPLDAAVASIQEAVRLAAVQVGRTPKRVVATFSGMRPRSQFASAEVEIGSGVVSRDDIAAAVAAAAPAAEQADARLSLHALATLWRIDGAPAVGDPVGRFGRRLSVTVHSVSVDRAAMRRCAQLLRGANLEMIAAVVPPYASALSAASAEERAMGAACVDIGAATTSIAIFDQGRLASVDSVPGGGLAITQQIAQSFNLALGDAEKLKLQSGSASSATPVGTVTVARAGAGPLSLERASLTAAIRPRVQEILENARGGLAGGGFHGAPGRPIILTGGCAELAGMMEAAEETFGPRVRLAAPIGVDDIAGRLVRSSGRGAWSSVIGLVRYAAGAPETPFDAPAIAPDQPQSGIWRWMRRNF